MPRLLFALQNYFDNRYWTMWKLPMFGCTDPVQVGTASDQRLSGSSPPTCAQCCKVYALI